VEQRTDAAVLADPRTMRLLCAVLAGHMVRQGDDDTPESAFYTVDGEDVRRPLAWLVEEGLVRIGESGAPLLTDRGQQIALAARVA
jgi:hypothetical protein